MTTRAPAVSVTNKLTPVCEIWLIWLWLMRTKNTQCLMLMLLLVIVVRLMFIACVSDLHWQTASQFLQSPSSWSSLCAQGIIKYMMYFEFLTAFHCANRALSQISIPSVFPPDYRQSNLSQLGRRKLRARTASALPSPPSSPLPAWLSKVCHMGQNLISVQID